MEVQAIQGYFDNGYFYQQGRRVPLPERKLVIVNVLSIPVNVDDTLRSDIDFWKEFDRIAADSVDEELMMTDFPRVHLGRELIDFGEEGDNNDICS